MNVVGSSALVRDEVNQHAISNCCANNEDERCLTHFTGSADKTTQLRETVDLQSRTVAHEVNERSLSLTAVQHTQDDAEPCSTRILDTAPPCNSNSGKPWMSTTAWFATISACILGGLAIWPAIRSMLDGHRAAQYAAWSAKKDFVEFCTEHVGSLSPLSSQSGLMSSSPSTDLNAI